MVTYLQAYFLLYDSAKTKEEVQVHVASESEAREAQAWECLDIAGSKIRAPEAKARERAAQLEEMNRSSEAKQVEKVQRADAEVAAKAQRAEEKERHAEEEQTEKVQRAEAKARSTCITVNTFRSILSPTQLRCSMQMAVTR